MELAWVSELLHRPIRFAPIEADLAPVTDDLLDPRGKLCDADVSARPDIDMAVAHFTLCRTEIIEVDLLHEEYAGLRHILAP